MNRRHADPVNCYLPRREVDGLDSLSKFLVPTLPRAARETDS
jgi:hypothetical protein